MFKKLFSRPKVKVVSNEPHPLKVNFATKVIPSFLDNDLTRFVNAACSEQGSEFLQNTWRQIGEKTVGKSLIPEPSDLKVYPFKEQEHLFLYIELPAPSLLGEPHFATVVVNPPTGGVIAPNVPLESYQYFIALHNGARTEILERIGDDMVSAGTGPEPDGTLFTEWCMNKVLDGSSVISVRNNDDEMESAIRNAQALLPQMLEGYRQGLYQDFTLKVMVTDQEENAEHFWLTDMQLHGDEVIGTIDAAPRTVLNITEGERYTFPLSSVTDWMYVQDGLIHGNYTMRVLLPHMAPEEAALYQSRLAPLP